jgi:hypothetical protein
MSFIINLTGETVSRLQEIAGVRSMQSMHQDALVDLLQADEKDAEDVAARAAAIADLALMNGLSHDDDADDPKPYAALISGPDWWQAALKQALWAVGVDAKTDFVGDALKALGAKTGVKYNGWTLFTYSELREHGDTSGQRFWLDASGVCWEDRGVVADNTYTGERTEPCLVA